jgi:hypothetical protein
VPGVIELRVYTLKPGVRDSFQRRFPEEIAPMLTRFGVTVVAAQPSLHDERSFTLIRVFPTLAERELQLASFYGSEELLRRHDETVMAMIEQYDTCVVEAGLLAKALLASADGG